MQNDFPKDIINQTAHRPWPLPDSPWLLTQSWHNLLFAHWPVDAELLRSRMPPLSQNVTTVISGACYLPVR